MTKTQEEKENKQETELTVVQEANELFDMEDLEKAFDDLEFWLVKIFII